MAALDVVRAIVPNQKVHAVGYCLGGTLLSIAAAAMAREDDDCLNSITLLVAQTDFTEAGELMLFINESQLAFLDDMMWEKGFLDTSQMAGAFQMLNSHDLLWSGMIREYLIGERDTIIDLMAWNTDTTRLPYRMRSEYLRYLFLNNDLAEGRLIVEGKPIALADIRAPIFTVGTVRDHLAPWRSTYKINLLTEADVTYLLTSGGHNAGVISEPRHVGHSFQVMTKKSDNHYVDPETYLVEAPRKDGSWWPEWVAWLETHSSTASAPPKMGATAADCAPLCDAPGTYVFQE
jgi:polyhydroxyalkanoate synthase